MRNLLVAVVVAAFVALLLVRFTGLAYVVWRTFHDSGYPWWIQVPAAVALAILFWMLNKRYKRGRFDGPF